MSNDDKDPLGLGTTMAIPLQIENGTFKTVSGVEAVETNMKALVLTERGDHVMNPGLGWAMKELISTGDLARVSQGIRQVLVDWENRIDHFRLDVAAAAPQNGLMEVVINYYIKNDYSHRTLKVDVPLAVASETNL